ncbi:MAG: FG-GAP-like repeat-containing protein [Enterobacterales bacterium]|nr:FG-GAP-like repeat-containing protein [Enterobacterales bacterium]
MILANSQQPTANSQQPTANSQQPTANSQQPTANHFLIGLFCRLIQRSHFLRPFSVAKKAIASRRQSFRPSPFVSLLALFISFSGQAFPGFGGDPVIPTPSTPQNILVPSSSNNGQYSLIWSPSSDLRIGSYVIEQSLNSGAYVAVDQVNKSVTLFDFSHQLNGVYRHRVKACNFDISSSLYKCSGWGYSGYISVNALPSTPATPMGPVLNDNGHYQVDWQKPAGTVNTYTLQERVDLGGWTNIYSGLALSKNINGQANGNYDYQVQACNSAGCSSFSAFKRVAVQISNSSLVADADYAEPYIPTPTGEPVGKVSGNAGVSGGAASYQFPIRLPPGRAGMAPSVSLSYSSRGGNSAVGVGWSLRAGSAISRCGQIEATDGATIGVTYSTSSDKFCLEGQRLILVSGLYGQPGAEYRTEQDSFANITQTSQGFQVALANGNINEYGGTADSIQSADGVSEPLVWAISRRYDRSTQQNNILYSYTQFAVGEHRLTEIAYTGTGTIKGNRRVEFVYESREDSHFSYLAGGKTPRTQRLANIRTYYSSQLIRDYRLSYAPSNTTQRSILQSVQECAYGDNGEACLKPTIFDWQDVAPSMGSNQAFPNYTAEYNPNASERDYTRYVDVNGDGRKEIIVYDRKTPNSTDWSMQYHINFVDVNGSLDPQVVNNQLLIDPQNESFDKIHFHLGYSDFNFDGFPDYLINPNGGLLQSVSFENIAADGRAANWQLKAQKLELLNDLQGVVVQVMDIDSDGLTDLLIRHNQNLYYRLNTSQESFGQWNISFAAPVLITDSPTDNYLAAWYFAGSTGAGINDWLAATTVRNSYLANSERISYMDLNGDGLTDILITKINNKERIISSPPTESNPYWTHTTVGEPDTLSYDVILGVRGQSGYGFSARISGVSLGLPGNAAFNQSIFADINGDGLNDYVSAEKVGSLLRWVVRFNQGDGTFAAPFITDSGKGIVEQTLFNTHIKAYHGGLMVMDIDQDGDSELLVATAGIGLVTLKNSTPNARATLRSNDELHQFGNQQLEPNSWFSTYSQFDIRPHQWAAVDIAPNRPTRILNNFLTSVLPGTHLGRVETGDINSDGYSDISYRQVNSICIDTLDIGCNGEYVGNNWQGRSRTVVSAVNIADTDTGIRFSQGVNSAPDLIQSVTDGLGQVSEWDYAPIASDGGRLLNEPALYKMPLNRYLNEGGTNYHLSHFYFASSMYVVSKFRQSSGLGATLNESRYSYREAVYNTKGRGFQGFRTILVDSPGGQRSVTDFHQIFPKAGKIESALSCLVTDDEACLQPFQRTTIQYTEITTANPQVHWVYPHLSEQVSFALNNRGLQLNKTTHLITEVDSYGNVKQQINRVDNGFSVVEKSVVDTFSTSDPTWRNKRLSHSVRYQTLSQSLTYGAVYDPALDPLKGIETRYTWTRARKPDIVTVTPLQGGGKSVTTDTDYNRYGQPTQVILSSIDELDRVVTSTYTSDSYFVASVTNRLGTSYTRINPRHGQADSRTDINGLTTSYEYDAFGRLYRLQPAVGPAVTTQYQWCDSGCSELSVTNTDVVFKVTRYSAGAPEVTEYKDKLARTRVSRTQDFAGAKVFRQVIYDALGRTLFESVPSAYSNETKGTSFSGYDALNRPSDKIVDQTVGQQLQVGYHYHGFETRIDVNHGDKTLYRRYSGNGQLMQTTDALNHVTRYAYDALGNPIILRDANQNEIRALYNALGQKIWVDDPNMGLKQFTYKGFGALASETDARQIRTSYEYDGLGRLLERWVNNQLEARFDYDLDNNCKGTISRETLMVSGENYRREQYYDAFCRPSIRRSFIDGDSFEMQSLFDNGYNRLKGLIYPNGLVVEYQYNERGQQVLTKDALKGTVYREILSQDYSGQWTKALQSNQAFELNRRYHPETGQMVSTEVRNASGLQQSASYAGGYDVFGNLTQMQMGNQGGNTFTIDTESYAYDDLHRLIRSNVVFDNGSYNEYNYAYDAVGNFRYKSDFSVQSVNAYQQGNQAKSAGGNAGPNAVRSVTLANGKGIRHYHYDNNGNLTNDGSRSIIYNAYNKPSLITVSANQRLNPFDTLTSSANTSRFYYGADQLRYKQVKTINGVETTTIYIGKHFEQITQNGQVTKKSLCRRYCGCHPDRRHHQ